jgi:hypothetical protein
MARLVSFMNTSGASPAIALEGINLRGTFNFSVAQHVSRLMPGTIVVPASGVVTADNMRLDHGDHHDPSHRPQ